jgi:hypothetical protein
MKRARPGGTVEVVVSLRDTWLQTELMPLQDRSIVPLGRDYFPHDPGTSCLATIVLSLRDQASASSRKSTKKDLYSIGFGVGWQPEAYHDRAFKLRV